MIAFSVRPQHVALYVLVMVVWALNFPVAKVGLAQLPPMFLIALRFILVAVLLLPFVPRPTGRWRQVFLISVTLGFLHFALMFTGLDRLDAATAAITIQLQVPFASILAAVFLGDRLGWRRALGMVIAFVGVAFIAGEPRLQGQYLALALVIAAGIAWSVGNLQVKLLDGVSGMTLIAWSAVFAAPQLLLGSLIFEQGHQAAVAAADWRALFSVAYQAVFVVVLGYGIWYWLLQRYEVNQSMPFTLLVPPLAVIASVVFLDEALTTPMILGGLMTVLGVGIITLRRPRTAAPEAERL